MDRYATVSDVRAFQQRGPWPTKSGGELSVVFTIPDDVRKVFFDYDLEEINCLPMDIRGLRVYTVRDLPAKTVGGKEFHRVRQEFVICLEGSVSWICQDLYGGRREFVLDQSQSILVPEFILHTYRPQTKGSGLMVIANTLFDPDDPKTHDTYSEKIFDQLKREMSQT